MLRCRYSARARVCPTELLTVYTELICQIKGDWDVKIGCGTVCAKFTTILARPCLCCGPCKVNPPLHISPLPPPTSREDGTVYFFKERYTRIATQHLKVVMIHVHVPLHCTAWINGESWSLVETHKPVASHFSRSTLCFEGVSLL